MNVKNRKRSIKHNTDSNDGTPFVKRHRRSNEDDILSQQTEVAGKIIKIVLRNIMCHDALEINLNKNVNFIVGKNGSGKSAILAGLTVGLGARAQITSRATAVNGIIKDKCSRGIIEVTLTNVGSTSYKHELYGDTITVVRVLGTTPQYKLKSASGHVISNKKSELDKIITYMNIQVDNPISVLNQEQAREFFSTSNSNKKYILFMKATQLDVIGENYRNAMMISSNTKRHLDMTTEQLEIEQQEIRTLENNLKILESLHESQKQLNDLQIELFWSFAIAEEKKLEICENKVEQMKEVYDNLKDSESNYELTVTNCDKKLIEFNNTLDSIENESQKSNEVYEQVKHEHSIKLEALNKKHRGIRSMQNESDRLQKDLSLLTIEIERLESGNNNIEQEHNQQKQRLAKMLDESREIEAMLDTNQVQQNHLEAERIHLENEVRSLKTEMDSQISQINKMKKQLNGFNQESGEALTVFGRNIPRLLKRIDEVYSKKYFNKRPCGPLGAFIKIKDPLWTPAIESFLGFGILSGFCVDNAQDARVLNGIMKEIYVDENFPSIVCSKFHQNVHNVSTSKTSTGEFTNLLDAMDITNPVVFNCLVDQREPECILLIPSSIDAKKIMGDRHNVPRNCRRALTQKGDVFFPDPHYRCYSNKVAQRAKWLQVSTREAITILKEDIQNAENDLKRMNQNHKVALEKIHRNANDYNESQKKIIQLSAMKNKLKIKIEQIHDIMMEKTDENCELFKKEKEEKQKQIEILKNAEKKDRDEIRKLDEELKELELKLQQSQKTLNSYNEKKNALRNEIRKLENEKKGVKLESNFLKTRLEDVRIAYEKTLSSVKEQNRVTQEVVERAQQHGPRVSTTQSPSEINRTLKSLQVRIKSVQEEFGSKEKVEAELKEKRLRSESFISTLDTLTKTNTSHLCRVENRRKEFHQMKALMATKVKHAFTNVLALRNYDGSIHIDHANKKLNIEVYPKNAGKKITNDLQTLSGGEKSYSTVAFILALWECTTLPFYFLDEFDVFMDKVNRRVIMDILMEHTKEHPERQFGFLTPLDASIVVASNYLTIHQLAAPERLDNMQSV